MRISDEHFNDCLDCEYKLYLKMIGESAPKTALKILDDTISTENRTKYYEAVSSRSTAMLSSASAPINLKVLKLSYDYLFDLTVENKEMKTKLDALEKTTAPSVLGQYSYVPILVLAHNRISRKDKLLLTFKGLSIAHLQGTQPRYGRIAFGNPPKTTRIRLDCLLAKAERICRRIRTLADNKKPPRFFLNKHCQVCEYMKFCNDKALKEDDLSVLKGMKEKE